MKKILILLLLVLLGWSHKTQASHLMGGEITWDCIKSGPNIGQFVFTVKLYRDCTGIPGPGSITLNTNAPGGNILCNPLTQTDISPTGPGCFTCATAPPGTLNAVEEYIYRSAPRFLTGVPPVGGWYFYYNDCCRNGAITNLANTNDFTLRAFMYPYNATNTNPCFDSSPQFAEKPQLATCTRNQTSYNSNAIDGELDSLVYSWGNPLENGFPGTNIPFAATYSFNSPMPGPALNPLNVAAVMNFNTGVVTFTSYTSGAFVTVTKVTAYKCGVKIAEVFREIQIALIANCQISGGPVPVFNTPPIVQTLLGTPLNTLIDTVYAGDTVEIDVIAFDFETLPSGVGQKVKLSATGNQFGTNFTNGSAGCLFPPCAVLTPPHIDTVPPINPIFFAGALQTKFFWITDCNHLPRTSGCTNLSSTYNFVLKVFDDFCPSPAVNFSTLTIVVLAPPAVKGARMKCADVLPNGNVNLTFQPPIDTGEADTNQFFKAFYVYRSTTGTAGPYTLLDSLKGFSINNYDTVITYNDGTANANLGPVSYYLTTRSGCDLEQRLVSDTISTIYLQVSQAGFDASLTWTPLRSPLPSSSTQKYYIYKEQPPAGSANWILIDSTVNLTYLDPITVCDDSINYRIQVVDTSTANCVSRSNIDGAQLQSASPTITAPSLRSTEVLANGDVALCWVGSVDTSGYFSQYNIYHSVNQAGPFVNVGSVSIYATNAFTHVGANANNQINYYYLTLTAGCDATSLDETDVLTSDTLASMLLLLDNSTAGFAGLNWNAIRKPLPATSTGSYIINRRIAPGAWAVIGNTIDTFYSDVVILCDTAIQYRVDIGDASACLSKSSEEVDQFTSAGDIIVNPDIRCLAVQPNGDVQISWIAPADPNNFFAGVQIYHSTAVGGPFALVGTVTNYATTSWLHVGANANTAIQYYHLVSLSGCDGLQTNGTTSATLATMLLSVNNATVGSAILTWNAMISPSLVSAPGPYRVMRRSTGIGAYVQVGTTAALTYTDAITTCNVPYEYRIELDDNAPCTSISSAADDIFTYIGNIIPNPGLRCVSVLPNGNIQLTWENPSPASFTDFNEYEIWSNSGAGFTLIDSVANSALNTYTDITANGNAQSYSYYLVTQSGCTGQVTTGTNGNTMSSIFLTTAGILGQANLNWSALCSPLLPSAVGGQYNVFSTYNALGTLQGIGNTPTLLFNHPINDCDTNISHQISVDDNIGCISRSNIATNSYTYIGNIVNNPDLRCVNVLANGQIQLSWITPTGSNDEFNEFEIFRNNGAGFVLYDSVSNFAQTSWTDALANGNAQSYSYYIRSQSGCTGQVDNGTTSATLSSIFLTSTPVLGSANLSWSALSTPLLGSVTTGQYDVWSSYNATSTLSVFGDTALLVYFQTINDCDTILNHKVSATDNSGCVSNSNITTNNYTYIGNIVNNPDLRCVNVLANGQIQLSWITPTGSNDEFNEFEIFRNNGAGFVLYDSVSNFAQTSWTDALANGNAQSYSYYIRSQSGCTGQVDNGTTSVTLSSIYLTTVPTLGNAAMNWTGLPLLASSGQYEVWSSYNAAGTLTTSLGTTSALTFNEAINNCDTTLRHRISVTDNSGCISNSNVDTNVFTYIGNIVDNPDLRCVNVLPSGQIELTWITPAGSNVNFNEYEIYRDNGAGFVLYDSVGNFAQTTWTDVLANGNTQSFGYYVRTQSGCSGQVDNGTTSASLRSIYLTTTPTIGQASLNWTALSTPLPGSVTSGQYDVWSSYNAGGVLTIFGDTNQLVYFQTINDCDTTLNHQISATDNSGCISRSNIANNVFTYIGNVIDHPELRCASVSANGQVQLTWVNPTPSTWTDFNQYNIWRNTGTGFVLIDSVENNAISTYLDGTANGNAGSVSYYLQTKSGCTGQTDPSAIGGLANGNTLQTIYIVVSGGNTTTATLNWNAVSNPLLPTSVGTYIVEKENPGGSGNWSIVANVAATTWQDNLVLCIDSINYRVSIGDAQGCNSLSNVDGEIFVDHTIPVAPAPRCANVLPNGNVILNWIAPVDTGQRFANYTIYKSSAIGGPYTTVTTITNYNTLTYSDLTANAQAGSIYYYMTTKTACGGEESPGSDTLRTIKVDVFNNNGVAVVVWNPIHNPELATATLNYDVYKEYPTGVWNIIGTTTAPTYTWNDTINVCEAVINYRVQTGDLSGCISSSSTDGDLFRDITRPTVSALDTASLDPFNPSQVSVSWLPSPSGDVVGYIIYHFNGASWDSIGSVIGINASYFLDNNPAAEFASQRYSIAAYDSCRNISNIGTLHNTLFVTAKLDVCRSAIDLRWNPYINMVNGVGQYNIYVSENGGPFTFLASVPGTNITYSHVTLTNNSEYCYYIQAQGNTSSRTASSNQACEIANLLTLPTFSYLKKATVIDLRRVVVECLVDTAGNPDVSKYKLQRAFDKNGPFTTVGAITYSGIPIITFNDFSARTDQYSYYYRVITVDSCSNDVLISNLGRTILLTGQPDFNLVNELKWNFYEEWLGNVSKYSLFRSVDGLWSPTPIATMNNGILDYNDDVAALYLYPNYSGKFCYRIEAYEGSGNTYGFTDTSVSNIFCLIQEPHLFIPSAFTPSGKNPVFKPEFIYIEAKNYFFVVFNRWGQRIYETRIPGEGWDGTYDGIIAPEGTYVYSVRIFGTNGQEIEKSGSVTLLR